MSERKAAQSVMSAAHTTKVVTMSSVKVVTSWARVADMALCPPTWLDHHTMPSAGALQELCPQWPTRVEMWAPPLNMAPLNMAPLNMVPHNMVPLNMAISPRVVRPLQGRNGPFWRPRPERQARHLDLGAYRRSRARQQSRPRYSQPHAGRRPCRRRGRVAAGRAAHRLPPR